MFEVEKLVSVFKLKRARVSNNNLMASCPFAEDRHERGEDEHASFGINLYSGEWHCFSCTERGSSVRTLAYKLKIMLPDDIMMESLVADATIKSLNNAIVEYSIDSIKQYNRPDLYMELLDRGISFAAIQRFKVGYREGAFQFPCILPDKKMCGWIERNSLWNGRYGYRPVGVFREHLLFGLDRKIKKVYLTESTTDMLKLVTFHEEAVSTCGNMMFDKQARMILDNCEEICLVPQNDLGAQKWLQHIQNNLTGKIVINIVKIASEYKDIGEIGYSKVDWQRDKLTEKFFL